jgi:hypothetical protein
MRRWLVRAVTSTSTGSYFAKRIPPLLRTGPDRFFQIARSHSGAADISLRAELRGAWQAGGVDDACLDCRVDGLIVASLRPEV